MPLSKPEIFVLRDAEGPILYAPLKEITARVNEGTVAAVRAYLNGEKIKPEQEEVLSILKDQGLFLPEEPFSREVPPTTHVTLFPTICINTATGANRK